MSVSGPSPVAHPRAAGNNAEDNWRADIAAEIQGIVLKGLETFDASTVTKLHDIERFVQELLRRVGGVLTTQLALEASALCPRPDCPRCHRAMEVRNRRARHCCGLTGDLELARVEYVCRSCGEVVVPADELWELGPGCLTPGLSRVVSAACADIPSCERAASLVGEALHIAITADTAWRTSEAIGAVAEQEMQQAMSAPVPSAPETEEQPFVLMVGMDACKVHAGKRWRDVKIGVVASLGPERHTDTKTGRVSLALGPRAYCAGIEDADRFYDRVMALASQAGWHPTRPLQVVLLGDGGEWIWNRAARLRAEGSAVIEILDIYHAREHIWKVAHTVLGTGIPGHHWGDTMATALLDKGPEAVIAALGALRPRGAQQRDVVRQALAYFQDNAGRMCYQTYLAKALPIGSGIVESSCRLVCGLRCKQPGMRWSLAGVQAILTLRAQRLSQATHWEDLWRHAPQRRRPPVNTLTKLLPHAA